MYVAKGYEWATHQPMIKAVMDSCKPSYILELGSGVYSTPLFMSYGLSFVTIENDKEWAEYIEDEYGIKPILHDLKGISEGTGYNQLSFEQRQEIFNWYLDIEIPDLSPKLLFVDNFCSCRLLAIEALKDKFDMIIYHDSESLIVNNFCEIDNRGFKTYTLRADGPYTTLMVKEDKVINGLLNIIQPYINEFLTSNPECKYMNLR